MAVYKHFSITILNEWKSQGFKLFEIHLLDPSNPYKAIVEVRPFKSSNGNWMTDLINSKELLDFALNDSPMVDYVINEHQVRV